MKTDKPRSEILERGLKTRREVLVADYVDRSLELADEFNWPLQQLTTEWCWDEIWNRSGLDQRSRSILNLGMVAALNRPNELKLHVRGAINNGLTTEALKEILLEKGVYCGMPAALDSFRTAKEVFKEIGID